MTLFARLALLLFCPLLSLPALARVEVEAVANSNLGPLLAVKISEDIAPGDYESLLRGITANPGRFARKIVLLDSIGGSAPEAIRMGRLLRETGFEAIVPSNGLCQGACVYLLAAGHKRTVRGAVGLHRPYFSAGDSALAEQDHRGIRYDPMAYFREMRVEPRLAEEMLRIEPGRMRLLSARELARYGLQ
jgi:hypothetical protein